MSAAKFKVGDRVRYDNGDVRTVVVAEPDGMGKIVTVDSEGDYRLTTQGAYELAPQRYVVELRVPKVGERYIGQTDYDGAFVVKATFDDYENEYPVIVDEVTS